MSRKECHASAAAPAQDIPADGTCIPCTPPHTPGRRRQNSGTAPQRGGDGHRRALIDGVMLGAEREGGSVCSAGRCSDVQCSAVQWCAVQCSAVNQRCGGGTVKGNTAGDTAARRRRLQTLHRCTSAEGTLVERRWLRAAPHPAASHRHSVSQTHFTAVVRRARKGRGRHGGPGGRRHFRVGHTRAHCTAVAVHGTLQHATPRHSVATHVTKVLQGLNVPNVPRKWEKQAR